MIGYCQTCGMKRTMNKVYTDALPNGVLVHKGICEVCTSRIWKALKDEEIMVTLVGRRFPKKVYVGKYTPKKLCIIQNKTVKTLKKLKQEVKENEKNINEFTASGNLHPAHAG